MNKLKYISWIHSVAIYCIKLFFRSKRLQSATDWRVDCRDLLEMMWQCDDSTPFREPVDIIDHPGRH